MHQNPLVALAVLPLTLKMVETPYLVGSEHAVGQQESVDSTLHLIAPGREPRVNDRSRRQTCGFV